MSEALLLAIATLAAGAGMAGFALSQPMHWARVAASEGAAAPRVRRGLRGAATLCLAASLVLCLAADHPTMAVLVWVMLLALAAAAVALLLAYRPRLLRGLQGATRRLAP